MIPFFSLQGRQDELGNTVLEAVDGVLNSGVYIGGAVVEAFENDFARYLATPFFVGVGNGLDALRLGLEALGLGPKDEVIVPAFTFVATLLSVVQAGAQPVPVDVGMDGLISVEAAEAAIGPNTVGILAVHLYGQEADMQGLRRLADRYGLFLAEDSAQAHGLTRISDVAGVHSDFSSYSFYPTKNLGGIGDGGGVATSSGSIAAAIRSMRSYGTSPASKYDHRDVGWNSRLDPIQAAALRVYLPKLDEWNSRRRKVANAYLKVLSKSCSVELVTTDTRPTVWHHFVIRSPNRCNLQNSLLEAGISTDIHYPQVAAKVPALQDLCQKWGPWTRSEALASQVLSLPMHPWLGRSANHVCEALSLVD